MYVLNYDAESQDWTLPARSPSTTVGSEALQPAAGPGAGHQRSAPRTTTITMGKTGGKGYLSYLPVPYAPQYHEAARARAGRRPTRR